MGQSLLRFHSMTYSGGTFYKILLRLTVCFSASGKGKLFFFFLSFSLWLSVLFFSPFKRSELARLLNVKCSSSYFGRPSIELDPRFYGGFRETLKL